MSEWVVSVTWDFDNEYKNIVFRAEAACSVCGNKYGGCNPLTSSNFPVDAVISPMNECRKVAQEAISILEESKVCPRCKNKMIAINTNRLKWLGDG